MKHTKYNFPSGEMEWVPIEPFVRPRTPGEVFLNAMKWGALTGVILAAIIALVVII